MFNVFKFNVIGNFLPAYESLCYKLQIIIIAILLIINFCQAVSIIYYLSLCNYNYLFLALTSLLTVTSDYYQSKEAVNVSSKYNNWLVK